MYLYTAYKVLFCIGTIMDTLLINFDIMPDGVLSGKCSRYDILTIPLTRKSYLLFCYSCNVSLDWPHMLLLCLVGITYKNGLHFRVLDI